MRRPTPTLGRQIGAGAALLVGALLLWWAAGPSAPPEADRPPLRAAAAPRPQPGASGPAARPAGAAQRPPKPALRDEDDPEHAIEDEPPTEGAEPVIADGPPDADTGGPIWDPSPDGQVAAIRSVMPEIKRCYDKWRPEDGSLAGRVEVQWVIGGDTGAAAGAGPDVQPVSSVETRNSELEHPMMELCVQDALRALRFATPASGEPVVVTVPFSFR